MLERLAGTLLGRVLSEYFEPTDDRQKASVGVWSGYLSLHNLRIKKDVVNEELAAMGQPFHLVHGSIRHVEITVPWSQWSTLLARSKPSSRPSTPASSTAVLVIDGLHLLLESTPYQFKDNLLRQRGIDKRRQALQEAADDILASAYLNNNDDNDDEQEGSWWKGMLRQRLQEGLLPEILDRLQIHIRDFHVRVEDIRQSDPVTPFCWGLVLESMHIQNEQDDGASSSSSSALQKAAHVNHLGAYWNVLEEDVSSETKVANGKLTSIPLANRILCRDNGDEVDWALDQLIARRVASTSSATTAETTNLSSVQHTYLLQPLDVHVQLTLSKTPKNVSQRPAVIAVCNIVSEVNIQLRDFQCLQLWQQVHHMREHYHSSRREYQRYRPTVSAAEDPRAWWRYAGTVVRYQLGQTRLRYSVQRARQRLRERRQYCRLFEQVCTGSSEPLTQEEEQHMQELEDGVVGDLSIPDILLFRIMVRRRVGASPRNDVGRRNQSKLGRAVRTLVADDIQAEEEYERLLEVWSTWTEGQSEGDGGEEETNLKSCVSVKVVLQVDNGRLSLFSPLAATADEIPLRRLQERFLDFTFTGFNTSLSLMGDYETLCFEVSLSDFDALAALAYPSKVKIVSRITDELEADELQSPLVYLHVIKYTPSINGFDMAVHARILGVQLSLEPHAEWFSRLRNLVRPLPQLWQASRHWDELTLANINSWASNGLGMRAKVETAASDHKKFDIDMEMRCPVIRISSSSSAAFVIDVGQAVFKTKKLAGVADASLLQKYSSGGNVGELHSNRGSRRIWAENGVFEGPLMLDSGPDVLSRSRSMFDSGMQSTRGSVLLGLPPGNDGSFRGEAFVHDPAELARADLDGTDIVFYDTYELHFGMGPITVEKLGFVPYVVSEGVDIVATFRKSILPADHTLYRLKLQLEVGTVALSYSMTHLQLIGEFLEGWAQAFSKQSPINFDEVKLQKSRVVEDVPPENASLTGSELSSAFDENEFFDAFESRSYPSGGESAWLDETWIVDSDSILDSETHSLGNGRRRRHRQPSLSDVSSLSDHSASRKQRQLQDVTYLSAENLARLEEGGEDTSGSEERCEAESFHSAVSASQMAAALLEVEEDIANAESTLLQLRTKLGDLRMKRSDDKIRDVGSRKEARTLALEYRRARAELKGLHAAHTDLKAQLSRFERTEKGSAIDDVARMQASQSVRLAGFLLRSRRQRYESKGQYHSMTHDLKRNLLQVSIVVHEVSVAVTNLFEEDSKSSPDPQTCRLAISESALVFRKRAGDSKFYFGVESMLFSLKRAGGAVGGADMLLVGGLDCARTDGLLGSSFPHLISLAEEAFVRGSIESRSGTMTEGVSFPYNASRLRLAFGDVEFKPRVTSIAMLLKNLQIAKDELSSMTSGRQQRIQNRRQLYFDYVCRLSALRMHLCTEETDVGAVVASELDLRLVGANSNHVLRDRSQLDARCSNLQVVAIDEFDTRKAAEVFGKKDVYCPLIRLRCRYQLVPHSELGGWVLGQKSTLGFQGAELGHDATNPHVHNCHADMQIEPFAAVVIPNIVCRLRQAMVLYGDLSGTPKAERVQSMSIFYPIRWHIDSRHRPSTLLFREDTAGGSSEDPSRILVAWEASLTAQRSERLRSGALIKIDIEQASITRLADEWEVLEPSAFGFELDVATASTFCRHMEQPWLRVQRGGLEGGLRAKKQVTSGNTDLSSDTSVGVSVSVAKIKFNISASLIVVLSGAFSNLAKALRGNRGTRLVELQTSKENENIPLEQPRKQTTNVTIQDISIAVHRDGYRKRPLSREGLFSLSVMGSSLHVDSRDRSTSLCLLVSNATISDLSFQPGALAFEETNDSHLENEMLVRLSVDKLRAEGRFQYVARLEFSPGQLVVLPSLLKSVLECANGFRVKTNTVPVENSSVNHEIQRIRGALSTVDSVRLDVQVHRVEFVLLSRSIPHHIRSRLTGPIGAVVLRSRTGNLRLDFGSSFLNKRNSIGPVVDRIRARSDNSEAINRITKFLESIEDRREGDLFISRMDIHVRDFQVLRTAISVSEKRPYTLLQTPPSYGEQRITNAFSISLAHNLSAWFSSSTDDSADTSLVIGHALQIKSEFVDIVTYIAQTDGGISEATRATVLPILETLRSESSRRESGHQSRPLTKFSVRDALVGASFIYSFRTDGIRITCVPGGATRLTESPIIKFAFQRIASGGAASPMKSMIPLSENSLEAVAAASGVSQQHLLAGAWLACEVSASYHNRRLVAWEPFIEPWNLKVRLGADLMRLLNLHPVQAMNDFTVEMDVDEVSSGVSLVDGGRSLREIGRLLSSPFKADRSMVNRKDESDVDLKSEADFCYIVLWSTASQLIKDAALAQTPVPLKPLWVLLPRGAPSLWLSRFGFPPSGPTAAPNSTAIEPNGISCLISDSVTLNVNITGALIENLRHFAESGVKKKKMAPHRIRNASGLTIRFREVLDNDRVHRGEKASKVTLLSGTEAPLYLKRSLSQSCDPHQAHISIELGSFEDTVGRVERLDTPAPKGSRFSAFSYKIAAKVPVDKVGIRQYPLDLATRSIESRRMVSSHGQRGWVVVRVSIKGGDKLVTVESPFMIENASDNDLLFEVREPSASSLVWRCLVPAQTAKTENPFPVVADIVPSLHNTYTMSVVAVCQPDCKHESEVETDASEGSPVSVPPPYSQSSFKKGVITETHISLKYQGKERRELLHLNLCSLRIGSISLETVGRSTQVQKGILRIPVQRMVVVRPSLVFRNNLAYSMDVEVRRKIRRTGGEDIESAATWIQLGILPCGEDCSWSGALPSEEIEFRARLCGPDGSELPQFPSWSMVLDIPPDDRNSANSKNQEYVVSSLAKLVIIDSSNVPLLLTSVSTVGSVHKVNAATCDRISELSGTLAAASRVVCFYSPFWIVDGTGMDLEYKSAGPIAGQSIRSGRSSSREDHAGTLGLGELLEDSDLSYLPSRLSFRVLMLGDDRLTRVHVRRKRSRSLNTTRDVTPWSDPIPLTSSERSYHDTFVSKLESQHYRLSTDGENCSFAVRSRIVKAPDSLGGRYGTRLLHVVCRYAVVNALGREIEVTDSSPEVIPADSRPRPFHFDDSRRFRFRPKEFGWLWSGGIDARQRRKELTISLQHKMKGLKLFLTIEFRVDRSSGTCTIIFRQASYPPYRIANRSMYPLQYRQLPPLLSFGGIARNEGTDDTIVLPFHDSEFAWDEPDSGGRTVAILVTDLQGNESKSKAKLLGSFRIDNLSPGMRVSLDHQSLTATIMSDGPTRVFCISDPSASSEPSSTRVEEAATRERASRMIPLVTVSLKLSHGIGISLVDWTPRELLYVRLNGVSFERVTSDGEESVKVAIGSIIADNQLWVTPYPVVLRIGSPTPRRRNRRDNAVTLSWNRSQSTDDLQLYEKVELATEPSVISVDGNLAASIMDMANCAIDLFSENENLARSSSRNALLKTALKADHIKASDSDSIVVREKNSSVSYDLYAAVDFMATSALAAKLRSHYKPPDQVARFLASSNSEIPGANQSLRKSMRKYYVEKLRVSATKAEISWSGPLPIASTLSHFMRPALTFEGLPVFLRPFSTSQSYGEADDYLEAMKSHYISIWRILDLVVGILGKPSFIVRACIFTWRDSIASVCESAALLFKSSEAACSSLITQTHGLKKASVQSVVQRVLTPGIKLNCAALGALSQFALSSSSFLRYKASHHRARAGLVRSRNPRLFANVDGNDLLVEYVEGKNAGQALLSRVRQGSHRNEGYVFHIEGAYLPKIRWWFAMERDSMALILMLTFDRILFLNGELNDDFCGVVWEVSLTKLVLTEQGNAFVDGYTSVLLWHLNDESQQFKRDELYAKSLVAGTGGLACMQCKPVLLPNSSVEQLFSKLREIDSRLVAMDAASLRSIL